MAADSSRKVDSRPSLLPSPLGFLAVFCYLCLLFNLPNFDEPFGETEVRTAVSGILRQSSPELEIHRVTRRKGADAGELGYYYVELQPNGFMVVPGNRRLPIRDARDVKIKVPYPDFFVRIHRIPHLEKSFLYSPSVGINLASLFDRAIRRKPAWRITPLRYPLAEWELEKIKSFGDASEGIR